MFLERSWWQLHNKLSLSLSIHNMYTYMLTSQSLGRTVPLSDPHSKRQNFRSFGPQKSHQKEAICPSICFCSKKSGQKNELNKGTGPVQKSPRKRPAIFEAFQSRYVSETRPVIEPALWSAKPDDFEEAFSFETTIFIGLAPCSCRCHSSNKN